MFLDLDLFLGWGRGLCVLALYILAGWSAHRYRPGRTTLDPTCRHMTHDPVVDAEDAELDASTGDGTISAGDFGLQTDGERKHELRGRIGTGGPTLKVRTGDGGITIAKR